MILKICWGRFGMFISMICVLLLLMLSCMICVRVLIISRLG